MGNLQLELLQKLKEGLVVSCQPVDEGPMDRPDITAAMALAAEAGGAAGLRIEGINNLKAVRPLTKLPIIAIVKVDLSDYDIRITPLLENIRQLAENGADIIAYDATNRDRPVPRADLLKAIKESGRLAMADCANLADAQYALELGADILGTTLSGYAYDIGSPTGEPDFDLITQFSKLNGFVMAEGRINSPTLAHQAMQAGADCVTVGSAITRIEHITDWFVKAVRENV